MYAREWRAVKTICKDTTGGGRPHENIHTPLGMDILGIKRSQSPVQVIRLSLAAVCKPPPRFYFLYAARTASAKSLFWSLRWGTENWGLPSSVLIR